MGQQTQAAIRTWQNAAGIKEADGYRAGLLREISEKAYELIKVIELERSGIRDGDGYWHGSDAMGGTAQHMAQLCNEWCSPQYDDKGGQIDAPASVVTFKGDIGGCPQCGQANPYVNVGRSHWFYCTTHKTKWCIGANLFSSWRNETEEEQRRIYDEIGLGKFTEVKPVPYGKASPLEGDDDQIPF